MSKLELSGVPRRCRIGVPAFLVLLLTAAMASVPAAAEDIDVDAFNAELEANGASWRASDSFLLSRTPEERAAHYGGFELTPEFKAEWESRLVWKDATKADLPQSFSWRNAGTTSVKDQGSCGSCWAFAVAGEVEALMYIYYGLEIDISEQQIVSCNPYGSDCDGGTAAAAYYVLDDYRHGGILEDSQPYAGSSSIPCNEDENLPFLRVSNWHSVPGDETQIKTALLDGPVCTTIDASGAFEIYDSGCYSEPGGSTNHLVVIVGWDDRACSDNGAWLMKNSWGTDFGDSGYIWVQYGAASAANYCTQGNLLVPGTSVNVTAPTLADSLYAEDVVDITWTTSGTPITNVDIYWGRNGQDFDDIIVEGAPNTGTYTWIVPNSSTDDGWICVTPASGTFNGFGFRGPYTDVGHMTRYVSALGSDSAPYESVATAAHSMSDAVAACTGTDTILVATGDYSGSVTIGTPVRLLGGWNETFTVQDRELYPTRHRGTQGAMRVYESATSFAGIFGFEFYDCTGDHYGDPVSGSHGGAIYCLGGSPTISDCSFDNCSAAPGTDFGLGGAVLVTGGSPIIENCLFTDNRATHGGAIALVDVFEAQLANNTFLTNICTDSIMSSQGAAIYMDGGSLTLDGDYFAGNGGVLDGGAIYALDGDFMADAVTMHNNRARNNGGAVCTDSVNVTMTSCEVTDNDATVNGGGLSIKVGDLVLTNVLVSGNTAVNYGGGVRGSSLGSGSIENCVFHANTSTNLGGGLFAIGSSSFNVIDNIIADNVGVGIAGAGGTFDYNLLWNNSAGDYFGAAEGLNDIHADPLFVDAAGGDFGLGLHSPAIDAGMPDSKALDMDGSPIDIGLHGGPGAAMVAPIAVADASVTSLGGGDYRFEWSANPEADLDNYVVYCDTAAIFVPSAAKVVATVPAPTTSADVTPDGDCYYVAVAVDTDGHAGGYSTQVVVGVAAVGESILPRTFALRSAVPNPFNPMTSISFDVPSRRHVTVAVYDLRGRQIRQLLSKTLDGGTHDVTWRGDTDAGATAAAGVYIVRASGGADCSTSKVVLAK